MKLFLIFLLLVTHLAAQRIAITKTSKKVYLQSIQNKLKKINIKMYIAKERGSYIVYSQDFTNDAEAQKALKRIQRYFPSAFLYTPDTPDTPTTKTTTPNKEEKKKFFASLGGGVSYISFTSPYALQNSLRSFNGGIGYRLSDTLSSSFVYSKEKNDDFTLGNFFLTLDYSYPLSHRWSCSSGLFGGYSRLLFDLPGSSASSSLLLGVTLALDYTIDKNFSAAILYRGSSFDHQVIHSATQKSEFSASNTFGMELRYSF